jgi:hypothetical protein
VAFEAEIQEIYGRLKNLFEFESKVRERGTGTFEPYQWGSDSDDPNYETVGHRPKADGFELRIVEVDWDEESFWFDAVVQKRAGTAGVWGPVRFALHPDFPAATIIIRKVRKVARGRQAVNEAKLGEVTAEGAFTVVAEILRADQPPLKLGYDLHRIDGLPKRFKWRKGISRE